MFLSRSVHYRVFCQIAVRSKTIYCICRIIIIRHTRVRCGIFTVSAFCVSVFASNKLFLNHIERTSGKRVFRNAEIRALRYELFEFEINESVYLSVNEIGRNAICSNLDLSRTISRYSL